MEKTMENTKVERTERDNVVLEAVNLLQTINTQIIEINDLYMSDVGKLQAIQSKLERLFSITNQGYIQEQSGELHYACCGDRVFKEDAQSWDSMKAKKDSE